MKNIHKQHLNEAASNAQSYIEFKNNLSNMGYDMPQNVGNFPMGMKSWGRMLRYEAKQAMMFAKATREVDIRNKTYYERLDKLGCDNPHKVMMAHPS